jgi:pilus assembly protein Flp/PilA
MEKERRRGQAMVEYALILVLIAVVVIGVLLLLGGQIKSIFTSISGALAGH